MWGLLADVGRYFLLLRGVFSRPKNLKAFRKEFMHQCVEIGIRTLPIVVIISVFIGAVTTIQTAYQLRSPLISKATIAQVVRDSVMIELSPTITGLILAGVIGSKIASELGNMRSSEQIDALEMMGVNAKNFLILPKILGALFVVPSLVIISMVLGIWGGREAGYLSGIVSSNIFDVGLHRKLNTYNIFFGLSKAYVYAFVVTSISAYHGYYVKGGALKIGRASTRAVVVSCVMILVSDFILAFLFL